MFVIVTKNSYIYFNHSISSNASITIHLVIGVIKLWIPNLAAIEGGLLRFDDKLPLALFRTKASDVHKYLTKKNDVTKRVQIKNLQLSLVPLPETPNCKLTKAEKVEIDTTRVRLCFQVKK